MDYLIWTKEKSKLDLNIRYHHIQIREGNEWKQLSRSSMDYFNGWLYHLD